MIPNAYLLGAPKTGTSSLFNWLVAHPMIEGTIPKETFYLMDEGNPLSNQDYQFSKLGATGYNNFFPSSSSRRRSILIDGTTHHIYQRTALDFIGRLEKKPKCIIILRKPSDRIYSSFAYSQNNLGRVSQRLTFPEYTDLLLSGRHREIERHIDSTRTAYVLTRNLDYCDYLKYVNRWVGTLGFNSLHICKYDDMRKNPEKLCEDILRFFGLPTGFFLNFDFATYNKTVKIRSPLLQKMLKTFAPIGRKLPGYRRAKNLYLTLNTSKSSTPKEKVISHDLYAAKQKIDCHFKDDMAALGKRFSIDLTDW